MMLLYTFSALLLIIGIILLFRFTPDVIAEDLLALVLGKPSLHRRVQLARGEKKLGRIEKALHETRRALETTGKGGTFALVCTASLALVFVGSFIGLMLDNPFLLPVLAAGCAAIPFVYVQINTTNYTALLNEEMETAMSIITSSYMRSDNIISAVEENLPSINQPIKDVFRRFLGQRLINSNVRLAIANMRKEIPNTVWEEWCDQLIACQDDRGLKHTLPPIVSKLTDVRIINGDLQTLLYSARKEYITLVVLTVVSIPILCVLNADWGNILLNSLLGKFLLSVQAVGIFVTAFFCYRFTRPISFKR